MALASQVATLEGLDDNISALYKKNDEDGFILDVTDTTTASGAAYGLANFGGLKSALESERGISSGLKADLAKYNGIDIEAANGAMEFQAKYTGKTSDDLDARVAELQKGYDEKLTVANTAAQAAINAKNEYQLGHTVDAALMGRSDLNESMTKWLRAEVLSNMGINDSGTFVKDASGNAKMSTQASNTGNMGVGELIDSMASNVAEYGGFFKAQGAGSGAGNQSSNGGAQTGSKPTTKSEYQALTQDQQVKLYHSDPAYYSGLANS